MSFLDKKTNDIVLEENSNFGYKLTFLEVTEQCSNHPVTGEPINCVEVEAPIDLSSYSFSGSISTDFDEAAIGSFNFVITDALNGIVHMHLDAVDINALEPHVSSTRDSKNPRYRFLGFYDVVATETGLSVPSRVMQGKVYFSDGVTP